MKIFGFATQPIMLLGLVILVGIACAGITYQRLSMPSLNQSQKAITASGDIVSTGLSIREIVAMNMFGTTSSEVEVVANHQDIPETNLKLSLKGAFSHSDPKQASALIASDKNKRAELYFIDAELPGSATLKEVHPSYVVLNRAGRLEKLLFFRSQGLIDPDRNKVHRSQSQNNNAAPKNTNKNRSQSQNNDAAPAAYVPPPGHYGPPQ
ncbi:MAG: type II secretion system protein N [Pseudomonadales bacterium]